LLGGYLGLSTQPEETYKNAESQEGFFEDSDTEYLKLDLERKTFGKEEGK
jgi:hypothetical protein